MHLWERGIARGERCACGRPFPECPFWAEVGDRAFGGWRQVDTVRMAWLKRQVDRVVKVPAIAVGWPHGFAAEIQEYVDHFVRVYRAAADTAGHPVVLVDSSKQPSLAWCLRRSREIDLRLVHCVRDSRGVAYSWGRTVARPEAVDPEHEMMPRYSPAWASAYWCTHNLATELLSSRIPSVRLRYEDLMADPRGSTLKLLKLAEVDVDPGHISPKSVTLGASHSCAGNPMRFTQGTIELAADESWRREQARRDTRLVTLLTAPLLSHYGYVR